MVRARQYTHTTQDTETLGTFYTFNVPSFVYKCSTPSKQTTYDELHKKRRKKNGARIYMTGGPFDSLKYKYRRTYADVNITVGAYKYSGRLCNGYWGNNPALGNYRVDTESLEGIGARGIARYKPGRPIANLGQAVVELRQIPTIPALFKPSTYKAIRTKILNGRALGSEYLNIEFGWKPFLQDLSDIIGAQLALNKALRQLARDNGKVVRRRGTVSHTESSIVTADNGVCRLYPILANAHYASTDPSNFHGIIMQKDWTRYWFSGAFRYWIPNIMKPDKQLALTLKLLNVVPTPKLLWDVLPWTWLADWFFSIGAILDNLSMNAAENLVMTYGYAMGTKGATYVAAHDAKLSTGQVVYATTSIDITHKRRIVANPFGFSATLPNLTNRQSAILAALGLSRSGKRLR